MIRKRPDLIDKIKKGFKRSKIVAILGPRQCGKTTIAKIYAQTISKVTHLDLTKSAHSTALQNPQSVLEKLSGLVIIDEVQLNPAIFSVLRVLVDRPKCPARFLILGSSSPQIIKGVSESLAGRIAFIDMVGFTLDEIDSQNEWQKLWLRGVFPKSFLARTNQESIDWREDFIRTFFELDIPALGISLSPAFLIRFWRMLAHFHAQELNSSELANALGMSSPTIKHYVDLLTGAFILRQIAPWHENIGKRQVKTPKIYFRDSGLLHHLLGIKNTQDLYSHPKCGHSWEGFIGEQLIHFVTTRNVYFWKVHSGAEIDFLLFQGNKRIGIEVKLADAPILQKGTYIAKENLKLDKIVVVYPGDQFYSQNSADILPVKDFENYLENL